MLKKLIVILLLLACTLVLAADGTIRISGSADFLKNGDTVTVSVHPYLGGLDLIRQTYNSRVRGGHFELRIPASQTIQYLDINLYGPGNSGLLRELMVLPGEDLRLDFRNGAFRFLGSSVPHYALQQELKAISATYLARLPRKFSPETLPAAYLNLDSSAAASLAYLEKYKEIINSRLYRLLQANIRAAAVVNKLAYLNNAALHQPTEIQAKFGTAISLYGQLFNKYPSLLPADSAGRPSSDLSEDLVYQRYLTDSCVLVHRKFNIASYYAYLRQSFCGVMRERLVTALFIRKKHHPDIRAEDIAIALSYVENGEFRRILQQIKTLNTVGSEAPVFTLPDADGNMVGLKNFRGKVVILDFWFTGCSACRTLAPVLAKLERRYANLPVVFITINIDKQKEKWLNSLKSHEYTTEMSVNLYTDGQGDRHQMIRDYAIQGYPTILLIDKQGKIAPNPAKDENGDAIAALIDRYLKE